MARVFVDSSVVEDMVDVRAREGQTRYHGSVWASWYSRRARWNYIFVAEGVRIGFTGR
jgi:hypothetical protein